MSQYPVARGGIEPPTFRFSGGGDARSETFVLVKLDERNPDGVADTERMKTNP